MYGKGPEHSVAFLPEKEWQVQILFVDISLYKQCPKTFKFSYLL